jgi:hypothetical protein
MCLFESDLESKKKKDFSFGLLLLLLCGREMGVNDGARLGRKEEEKLCVVEDQKIKKKWRPRHKKGREETLGGLETRLFYMLFYFIFSFFL